MLLKIGITGQGGFIGKHLYNSLGLQPEFFQRIPFKSFFFSNTSELDTFVSTCDVIVHLAALNRHNDPEIIYQTNLGLVEQLTASLVRTGSKAHVIFSSSTQEEKNNQYGKSKKKGREILAEWASKNGGAFTGLIIPNVFGPFGDPYYNSVIATFCYQLTHNETPKVEVDGVLNLIYINELVKEITDTILEKRKADISILPATKLIKVSSILSLLQEYRTDYFEKGIIPKVNNEFELNLFNTFRCYADIKKMFPVKFIQHTDKRGVFTELVKLKIGGQVSFSITLPGITRGNHFHTRKIERFAVIKGKARIQLRRIGTDDVIDFFLSGDQPAYVDIPVWHTHNITNIGKDELYTVFWINEIYDLSDADTFFENV